jgi:hypothetical protein
LANYNENKVKEGNGAYTSAAGNYPINAERLLFDQRLNRLMKHPSLNENVTANSVHISLNFHPSDKLFNEQLNEVSAICAIKLWR